MKRYLVIFEKTATGYSAYVPDLPGCIATGDTKLATELNMAEALQFHLEGMALEGLPIPPGNAEGEVMVIAA